MSHVWTKKRASEGACGRGAGEGARAYDGQNTEHKHTLHVTGTGVVTSCGNTHANYAYAVRSHAISHSKSAHTEHSTIHAKEAIARSLSTERALSPASTLTLPTAAQKAWGSDSPCGTHGDDGDGQGSRFWAGAQRPPHRPLETAPAGRKILAVLGRRNTDFTQKETVNCNLQLSIFSALRPLHGHARPLLTPP